MRAKSKRRGPWSRWSTLPAGWRSRARDVSAYALLPLDRTRTPARCRRDNARCAAEWLGSIPAASTSFLLCVRLVDQLPGSNCHAVAMVQQLDRASADFGRQVRVAHRHLDRRVPQQLLHRLGRAIEPKNSRSHNSHVAGSENERPHFGRWRPPIGPSCSSPALRLHWRGERTARTAGANASHASRDGARDRGSCRGRARGGALLAERSAS